MILDAFLFATGLVAAAIAAVAGFGFGSLLTPAFGLVVDTRLAVAAVSVPHALGTAVRFWALRRHVNGGSSGGSMSPALQAGWPVQWSMSGPVRHG